MSRIAERLTLFFAPRLGYWYIRACRRSMRIAWHGREALEEARRDPGRYILAFWHSRFVMMPYAYPGDRITVMSSTSRDSELLARVLVRFGLDLSKGSSTRGGASALRDVVRKVRGGYDVGFTPDGPKGPRRRAKPGVVSAARLTGLPIIPVAFSCSRGRRLGSWDRTLLPIPFSKGLFLYGRPVVVPREADSREEERLRGLLEAELDRVTDEADRLAGIEPEDPRPPIASP